MPAQGARHIISWLAHPCKPTFNCLRHSRTHARRFVPFGHSLLHWPSSFFASLPHVRAPDLLSLQEIPSAWELLTFSALPA